MKNKKTSKQQSTQNHLPIGEIRHDSVVLKNGGIRGVIKVSTINFGLKSENEQQAVILAYQSFFNSLEFPIQICIQSRKVDLDPYFEHLEEKKQANENELLKSQTGDYIEYLKKLSEFADIMEKNFYIVVPSDPSRKALKQNFLSQFFQNMTPEDSLEKVKTRYLEFKSLSGVLSKRIDIVEQGLKRCGLRTERLSTQKLINLYYKSYNPTISQFEKIKDTKEYNIA